MAVDTENEPVEFDDDIDESDTRLTPRQRVWAFSAGAISFVVFLIVLFPFEGILRSSLQKRLAPDVKLEFTSMQLGLLGQTKVEDLSVQSGNFQLEADSLVADLKKWSLLRLAPKGMVRLNGGNFAVGSLSAAFKSLDVNLDMSSLDAPASDWEGTIQIRLDKVEPEQLPDLLSSLPISADELTIQRLSLPLQFRRGRLDFNQSQLQSPLFTIRLEGGGKVGASLFDTSLDGKICLKPVDDLEVKNEAMFGFYIMAGGSAGGELCMRLSGMLSSPNFDKIEPPPAAE